MQRDHGPVGVPDQVRAIAEQLGEQRRLGLEVPACEWCAGPEARPIGEQQGPARGQLELMAPGAIGADDAAMDEQHRRSGAGPLAMQAGEAHGMCRFEPIFEPN